MEHEHIQDYKKAHESYQQAMTYSEASPNNDQMQTQISYSLSQVEHKLNSVTQFNQERSTLRQLSKVSNFFSDPLHLQNIPRKMH